MLYYEKVTEERIKRVERKVFFQRLAVIAIPVALTILTVVLYPSIFWLAERFPPCIFYKLTGLLCPGCGNTHSVLALLQGNLLGSIQANMVPVLGVIFAVLGYFELLLRVFGKKIKLVPRSKKFYLILGILAALYFVLRNLPFFWFLHI